MCGVPYVGSDARSARVAWSKPIAKTLVHRAGVATPDYVTLPPEPLPGARRRPRPRRRRRPPRPPLVVKPARGGSALGVTTVTDRARPAPGRWSTASPTATSPSSRRRCTGIEVAVSVVGDGRRRVRPAAGRDRHRRQLRLRRPVQRRAGPSTSRPPGSTPRQTAAVADAALAVHRVLGLRHLSRTDLILDADGRPVPRRQRGARDDGDVALPAGDRGRRPERSARSTGEIVGACAASRPRPV